MGLLIAAAVTQADPVSNANLRQTPTAGGQSGKDFSETQPDGGALVGLDVWKGEYYRALVIGAIRAVYQTDKGSTMRGEIHGRGKGDADVTLQSKTPGSPIVGIETVDDKQQVVAMRVKFANGEMSEWFGRDVPKNLPANRMPRNLETKHLNVSSIKGALGIYGGADGTLFRFGLLY